NAACLLGLPGKMGFSGAQVWDAYQAGNLVGIRRYCETDVLNTYLVYLRFELMRAHFTRERYAEEVERVKVYLRAGADKQPHYAEFLATWESASDAAHGPPAAQGEPPTASGEPPARESVA